MRALRSIFFWLVEAVLICSVGGFAAVFVILGIPLLASVLILAIPLFSIFFLRLFNQCPVGNKER